MTVTNPLGAGGGEFAQGVSLNIAALAFKKILEALDTHILDALENSSLEDKNFSLDGFTFAQVGGTNKYSITDEDANEEISPQQFVMRYCQRNQKTPQALLASLNSLTFNAATNTFTSISLNPLIGGQQVKNLELGPESGNAVAMFTDVGADDGGVTLEDSDEIRSLSIYIPIEDGDGNRVWIEHRLTSDEIKDADRMVGPTQSGRRKPDGILSQTELQVYAQAVASSFYTPLKHGNFTLEMAYELHGVRGDLKTDDPKVWESLRTEMDESFGRLDGAVDETTLRTQLADFGIDTRLIDHVCTNIGRFTSYADVAGFLLSLAMYQKIVTSTGKTGNEATQVRDLLGLAAADINVISPVFGTLNPTRLQTQHVKGWLSNGNGVSGEVASRGTGASGTGSTEKSPIVDDEMRNELTANGPANVYFLKEIRTYGRDTRSYEIVLDELIKSTPENIPTFCSDVKTAGYAVPSNLENEYLQKAYEAMLEKANDINGIKAILEKIKKQNGLNAGSISKLYAQAGQKWVTFEPATIGTFYKDYGSGIQTVHKDELDRTVVTFFQAHSTTDYSGKSGKEILAELITASYLSNSEIASKFTEDYITTVNLEKAEALLVFVESDKANGLRFELAMAYAKKGDKAKAYEIIGTLLKVDGAEIPSDYVGKTMRANMPEAESRLYTTSLSALEAYYEVAIMANDSEAINIAIAKKEPKRPGTTTTISDDFEKALATEARARLDARDAALGKNGKGNSSLTGIFKTGFKAAYTSFGKITEQNRSYAEQAMSRIKGRMNNIAENIGREKSGRGLQKTLLAIITSLTSGGAGGGDGAGAGAGTLTTQAQTAVDAALRGETSTEGQKRKVAAALNGVLAGKNATEMTEIVDSLENIPDRTNLITVDNASGGTILKYR